MSDAHSVAKARENFSEIVNRVAYGKEHVVITRRGKQLVAFIPLEDYSLLLSLKPDKQRKRKGTAV